MADEIEVMVIEIRGDQVRLGIVAPRSIPVHRKELLSQIVPEDAETSADSAVNNRNAHL